MCIFPQLVCAENVYETFPAQFNLVSLNGQNGFAINGINSEDNSGWVVGGIGDINGDGIDDICISAPYAGNDGMNGVQGQSYVLFGGPGPWPKEIDLTYLNGNNGFIINGRKVRGAYGSAFALSKAGDINKDGIDDLLINAPAIGETYLIFGSKQKWPVSINLENLNGNNGFLMFTTPMAGDWRGGSVSKAGDVNGDGIDDILIGASNAMVFNQRQAGQSYVVFGSKEPWPPQMSLNNLNGTNGFMISGNEPDEGCGFSVSEAGDVNNDGLSDILIGGIIIGQISPSFIIFGSKEPWPDNIYTRDLNGTNGFTMEGFGSNAGYRVTGIGDINGDEIADILIGSPTVVSAVGQSYVVFGRKGQWPETIDLTTLNGVNGFIINGVNANDNSGWSVASAGDVNDDAIEDILVSAPFAHKVGQSYVVFGTKDKWPVYFYLEALNGTNGFAINGINPGDNSGYSISGAGDFNGDGIADIVIGAPQANNGVGQSYIIFGERE